VARRATKIAQERQKGGSFLLLDAGDSLANDQDPARKTKGQSSVAVMNMMAYDAMALGPLDLALGLTALRQAQAMAKFAMLSANAVVSATGQPVVDPYVLRKFGDHTVAIIGLSGGRGNKEIAVRDPLKTAQTVVAEVAKQADVIILLSHAGAELDQQIANSVPGLDLIVSGGGAVISAPRGSEKTGTIILRADQASPSHAGLALGIGKFTFDPAGKLAKSNWQLVRLSPEIADDPTVATWVQQQRSQ